MTTNPVPSSLRLGQATRVTGKVVPFSEAEPYVPSTFNGAWQRGDG